MLAGSLTTCLKKRGPGCWLIDLAVVQMRC